MNKLFIFIIFILIFTIILITLFIRPNLIENFDNKSSIESAIRNNTVNDYINNYDFITRKNNLYEFDYKSSVNDRFDVFNNDLLFAFSCIKHNILNKNGLLNIISFYNQLSKNFKVSSIDLHNIMSINQIQDKIVENINSSKLVVKNNTINGNIYAVIYQAPYLRYNKKEIYSMFDMNNMLSSYEQDKNNIKINQKGLFVKLYILYPNYDKDFNEHKLNRQGINTGVFHFKQIFTNPNIVSRDNLCFMNCVNNINMKCGCLNLNNPKSPYKSTCLDNKGEKTNYGMVYYVNKENKQFK